jgi:predicted unusual protein kinase regulating ubiquinone biosynthesis (AarF/ABC1/UbiB family)
MDEEQDSLGGRLKRYMRVGRAVGGVAAKVAGNKILGAPVRGTVSAADLRDALGGLKGPLMKVAQILSAVPDLLPEEYSRELIQLQSNAPSMGWPFVRRRMTGELGSAWMDQFASFDRKACAAASLGQVHRATLDDGRSLACKLQYPDMASAVEADLKQLRVVFALYRRYDSAIDPSDIHTELSDRLREELDYEREVRHMRLYEHMLSSEPAVHVPEAVDALCTSRLLSMSWLDGRPLLEFAEHALEVRNEIALNMFHAWYRPFYDFGIIHGDPHLGNYSVREDHGINLLDFGCIRVFPSPFVGAVINLYRALRDGDEDLAVHAYETWGFSNLSRDMIAVLNQWAAFLYGPLMEDKTQLIHGEEGLLYGARTASQVHAQLRTMGGVKPPREFVLMDRAAIGLGSVFTHLGAEINWHQTFHSLIDEFDETALAARQQKALEQFGLSDP